MFILSVVVTPVGTAIIITFLVVVVVVVVVVSVTVATVAGFGLTGLVV